MTSAVREVGVRDAARALAVFGFLALAVAGPAIVGPLSLGPESVLDAQPLYRTGPPPPPPPLNDLTRAYLDLPRDLRLAGGLWRGRLERWEPLSGCGAPLWAEQGGPFFPLKLAFYLMPSRRGYDVFAAL